MKSTRYEAFLSPPIVYDKIEPRIWLQNLKPKKSVASQSLKAILKIIYRMKNIRKPKKHGILKYKRKSALWKLINHLLPEKQHRKIEKKSRSKRSIAPNIKSDQESIPTRSERQKRSNNGNLQNLKYPNRFLPAGNSKYLPNLAMFYRHPELSVEEQHQQLNDSLAESKKSRREREDNRISKLKPHKPLYTSVFKECNDTTAASEVEDLNLPPPRLKYLKRKLPNISGINNPTVNDPLTLKPDLSKFDVNFSKIPKIVNIFKDIKRPKIGPIWESVKRADPKNITYINLRDHQAEAKQSIQADGPMKVLPDLAIAAIPRNATYVNLRDHQAETKKSIQADGRMKILPDLPISATPLYPKDIQPYNPDNIPYVEVPDYTDQREESLDEDDRRVAKERYTNIEAEQIGGSLMTDRSKNLDPDVPIRSEALPDPVTTETLPLLRSETDRSSSLQKGYMVGEDERFESVNKPLSKDSSNDDGTTQKLQLPKVQVEDVQIEKTVDDEDQSIENESPNREDDDSKSIVDFQPVYFDINDYIKPFDFDKLFEVSKKKFSEELKDDSKEISGSERIESGVTRFPDHFTSRYKNLSPAKETSTKSDEKNSSKDIKEIPIIKPEEFYVGSKDFFKLISEEERKKSDRFASESDFLSRYFNDDVDDKLEKESVDKTEQDYESRDSSDLVKGDGYKTLSSSLERKDYAPKFYTESKETERDDGVPPQKYHDFWRLEYTFPHQKINSALQKNIDEENKKNFSS